MTRQELNKVYERLESKARELRGSFVRAPQSFNCTFGFYNGHYRKNDRGEYERDNFPIPEITVPGLCDIEVGLESITITTKLSREQALSYDYGKIAMHSFEAYGVEDYLCDFYVEGDMIAGLIENIKKSCEKDIGFSFCFPFESDGDTVYGFIAFLHREGFFY